MSAVGLSMHATGHPGRAVPRQGSIKGLSRSGFHRMAYVAWGQPNDLPPVVCVHGLTRNGRDFDRLAAGAGARSLCGLPRCGGAGSERLAQGSGRLCPAAILRRSDGADRSSRRRAGRLARHLHGRADRHDSGRPAGDADPPSGPQRCRAVHSAPGAGTDRRLCRQGSALCGSGEPRGLSAADPCAGRRNGRRGLAAFRRIRASPPAGRQLWPRL